MKSIYIILSLLLVCAVGRAQNAAPYEFKTGSDPKAEPSPEFDQNFKFSTSKEVNPGTADPVAESETEAKHLYKLPIGYPKKDFYASYNPGINSFKYTLTDVKTYNLVSNSTQDLTVGFRYNPSIDNYFNIELRSYSMSLPAFTDTGAGLNVLKSTATPLSFALSAPFLCSLYETSSHRFCPGFMVGLDSFPTLNFVSGSNTDLELANVQDMVFGLTADYKRPLIGSSIFIANGGLSLGFGLGQSSNLGTRRNTHFNGAVGLEWNVRDIYVDILGGFDYRQAVMRSSLDEWRIENASTYAKLGLRFEFGP